MAEIDRMAPRSRPTGRVAMKQRWAELLFLHWVVPIETLRSKIPPELSIDTFEGNAYVGLVPFTMSDVRPAWAPAFGPLSNFHETNVRTYVHYEGRDPGVWFFSLDAASTPAVLGARTVWSLPYHRASMSLTKRDDVVSYRADRRWPGPTPAHCNVDYRVEGAPNAATPGTLEFFLAERYILYAQMRDGSLRSGRVHHVPYPLQPASVLALDETILVAEGIARPTTEPLAHFASEVTVDVFALEPISSRS